MAEMNQEDLIEKVKCYEELYNVSSKNYKDPGKRSEAWEAIANEFDMPVYAVKYAWCKLRNCYTNAIKRRKKKYNKQFPNWKYESQMSFLLPFMEIGTAPDISTESQELHYEEVDIIEDDFFKRLEDQSTDSISFPPQTMETPKNEETRTSNDSNIQPSRKRKTTDGDNYAEELLKLMKVTTQIEQKRLETNYQEYDSTDMFFLSMSKAVKLLPKREQAKIKMELCRAVSEAEMRQEENAI